MLLILQIGLSSKRKWDFNQGFDFTVSSNQKWNPEKAFRQKSLDMKRLGLFMDFTWATHLSNKYHPSTFINIPVSFSFSLFSLYSHGSHCIVAGGVAFHMHNQIQLFVTNSLKAIYTQYLQYILHKGTTTTIPIYVFSNVHHYKWTICATRLNKQTGLIAKVS